MRPAFAIIASVSAFTLFGTVAISPAAAADAQTGHRPCPQVATAGIVGHGMVRCVRSAQCRDAIARRAQRVVQIVSELALGGAEAISDLVSEMLEDPHEEDVLKRLDWLERMLREEGLYTAEVRREVELIRAAYED